MFSLELNIFILFRSTSIPQPNCPLPPRPPSLFTPTCKLFTFTIFLLSPTIQIPSRVSLAYLPFSLLSLSKSLCLPRLTAVIFKEVNTCNPATITGTLSRISLDDEDDPKLAAHQEGGVGVNFSTLPGNIPPPNLIVQVHN